MAAGSVRHADMQSCAAQRSAQEEQRPRRGEEEEPRERGGGPLDQDRALVQHDVGKTMKTLQNGRLERDGVAGGYNGEGRCAYLQLSVVQ